MIAHVILCALPLTVSDTRTAIDTLAAPLEASTTETSTPAELLEPVTFEPTTAAPARGGGTYLRVSAGFLTMEDSDGPDEDIEFNEGYLLGLAFGQRMNSGSGRVNFDLELEAIWTDQDADDDGPIQAIRDVSVGGLFLNGTADFPLGERLSVYVGAGIGGAWVDVGTQSDQLNDFDSDDGPNLAWQGRAGFQWAFSESTALNLGYRFINIDDTEIDDDIGTASFDLETTQHVAEIGLRFGL